MDPFPTPNHDAEDFNKTMAQISSELYEESSALPSEEDEHDDAEPTGKDKKLKTQLEQAVASGHLDTKGGLGQRFKRELTPEETTNYLKLKSDKDRAAFRLEWGQRRLRTLVVTKRTERSWRRVDVEHGEYLTFPSLCLALGYMADKAVALQGARNYASRCIKLAGKWVHHDNMSNMVMFLYLRKEYKEEMSKAWLLYEQHEQAIWHRDSQRCNTPITPTKFQNNPWASPPLGASKVLLVFPDRYPAKAISDTRAPWVPQRKDGSSDDRP